MWIGGGRRERGGGGESALIERSADQTDDKRSIDRLIERAGERITDADGRADEAGDSENGQVTRDTFFGRLLFRN